MSDNYFEGKKKKVQTEPKEMITPALEKALTKQGNENLLNTINIIVRIKLLKV